MQADTTAANTFNRPAAPAFEDCAVLELRDYTMQPGQRDVLIDLFEREFIAAQEVTGMRVIGHFRDLDRPDHFVWLRGFAGMQARHRALEGFYTSAVWLAHREAANATLIDSDHVNLLRPARPTWALNTPPLPRPRRDSDAAPACAVFVATVCVLPAPPGEPFKRGFEREALPLLRECAAMPIAVFETEAAVNSYPRLPVRSEWVFIWLSRFAHEAAAQQATARLNANPSWTGRVWPLLATLPPRLLRLQPTACSWLR